MITKAGLVTLTYCRQGAVTAPVWSSYTFLCKKLPLHRAWKFGTLPYYFPIAAIECDLWYAFEIPDIVLASFPKSARGFGIHGAYFRDDVLGLDGTGGSLSLVLSELYSRHVIETARLESRLPATRLPTKRSNKTR